MTCVVPGAARSFAARSNEGASTCLVLVGGAVMPGADLSGADLTGLERSGRTRLGDLLAVQ